MEKQNVVLYIHTLKLHLAIKRNELVTHATIWINLRNSIYTKSEKPDTEDHILPTIPFL